LHASGHLYFTLKDEGAQIAAICWRSRVASLRFEPEDGMKVIARGSITVYPPRGNYQLDVVTLQPVGVGALQLAFEKLKKKLQEEGLFDPAHKKPIPQFPRSIGIVTSSTGAAIHDIMTVIERRFPVVELILRPVQVQGEGAAEDIACAIRDFNSYGEVDVLIVGRGGGSLEDLWAFNEEIVARAIYNSKIPIISAVGHEIDFTIADFVADLRAPTPSAAGELVVPDRTKLLETLDNIFYTLKRRIRETIELSRNRVQNILTSYAFGKPLEMIRFYSQRADEAERGLKLKMEHKITLINEGLNSQHKQLLALSPEIVLKRGYSIIWKDGESIRSSKQLLQGENITIQFYDGKKPAEIKGEE
jgi:exodeoxyribonuclease VII large subunit